MAPETTCAIAVMAKAPRAGRVKTRLVPPLDPEGALRMSAAFLRDITCNIALAAEQAAISGWVAYAPAGLEGHFDGLLAPGTQLLLADGSTAAPDDVTGFGRCLLQATEGLFARGFGSACVLNTASPTLPTAGLVRGARLLAEPGQRAVLGAAEDGGYYVLGMQRPHARLFADIAWSTGEVAARTRARAAEIGLDLVELPEWYDVDDRAALRRLLAGEPARADGLRPYAAPATAACCSELDVAGLLAAEA